MREFNEAMDRIVPSEEQKQKMFDKAVSMAEEEPEKPLRRKRIKAAFIGIIAAAAMAGTTAVFADEIKSAFYRFFDDDSIISENIIENIYEDTDGHVYFSVSRIVSDKMNTYAIVRYTAIDDLGRDWLYNDFVPLDKFDESANKVILGELMIEPGNYEDHYKSSSKGLGDEEITETDDENSRVFKIRCHTADVVYNTDNVRIKYTLPTVYSRSALLDVSESLELIDIKLDSSVAADRPYIPTGVKLSPLGIMVYGDISENYDDEFNGFNLIFSDNSEHKSNVKIVAKDGSYIHYNTWMYLCLADEDEDDYDIQIFTTFFKDPIETDDIAGIYLDGVYYGFSQL